MKKILIPTLALMLSIALFVISIIYGSNNKRNELIYSKGYVISDKVEPTTTFAYSGLNVTNTGKGGYYGDFGIPEDGNIEFRFKLTTDKDVNIHFEDSNGNVIFNENTNKIQYVKTLPVKKGNWKFKISSSNDASGQFTFNVVKK